MLLLVKKKYPEDGDSKLTEGHQEVPDSGLERRMIRNEKENFRGGQR